MERVENVRKKERKKFWNVLPAASVTAFLLLTAGVLNVLAAGPGDAIAAAQEESAAAEASQETAAAEASQETAATSQEAGLAAAKETQEGLSEEEADRAAAERAAQVLSDNVLRYDELQDAVHNGNPSVASALKNYNDRLDQYVDAMNAAVFEQWNAGVERKNAWDDNDRASADSWDREYETYKASAAMYRKMYENMSDYASQRSIRQVERQMTVAAQSLMISYESLRHQRDTLQKEVALRRRQRELADTKRAAGLVSDLDVMDAEAALLSAESRLSAADDSLRSVYQNLCYAVGRPDDGSLIIEELPAPDPARVSEMNLEADTWKAIGNNTTLINQRRQNGGSSTPKTAVRLRTNAEGEQKLTAKMASLYEAVLQKQQEYNSAKIAWEKAQETKRIADLKASAGLAGQEEQLTAEMNYTSAEASFKAAELAFLQALDTYDWAVTGIASLD
ncbi:MAG: TolC family protein [Stomatobaculum sp.]|nr:TolC family protein [Stomatobaculum sp.]